MTRTEALSFAPARADGIYAATGCDGERWFWSYRSGAAEWTREIRRAPWGLRTGDAPLDPDGADWAPDLLSPPDEAALPQGLTPDTSSSAAWGPSW
jgi:hypothetical protein